MAVKITDITISPKNEVTVGQTITITIKAVDVTWGVIKEDFSNWNTLKTNNNNWNAILNHH